jgi:SAM-dependent methyltransferase
MTYHKRTTCRLCDGSQLTVALHYPPQPLADNYQRDPAQWQVDHGMWEIYPLDLYLCDNCGCAQLLDVVSGDEIYPSYTYETGSSPALVEHFRQYAVEVHAKIKPRGLVVDIGSNDGTLLKFFQQLGLKLLGVDPAPLKTDVPTLRRFFDADVAKTFAGRAALVTANNVYANIDDLRGFTEAVRNLLAPDGVFVFETFYLADFIDHMVFDFIYHEHLTAFALSPLIGFFQRLGMQVFDVQRVATKGGSIRVYVQHDAGKRPVSVDVPALVEWEYLRGLHNIALFDKFGLQINDAKAKLGKWLSAHRTVGQNIAGYGASPTSTTLIYSWELRKFLGYLIDDWPGKQGTFSPGLHLPVKPPAALDADYCIILAWRYADQIMARNPQYRGTWIVPLPELRVILARSR